MYDKEQLLREFRTYGNTQLKILMSGKKTKDKVTSELNKLLNVYTDNLMRKVIYSLHCSKASNEQILHNLLLIKYVSYVVMLECRNQAWPYDYMTFSRRIGELWEPFCKLTFSYPLNSLEIVDPLDFDEVQNTLRYEAEEFINSLPLSAEMNKELLYHYNRPWVLVDSGGISLKLDLHFCQNNTRYNCDFKSGFSSNEKGNTNRLLLVASIYNSYFSSNEQNSKNILLVRQSEEENNHYLKTLKNSGCWDVYCGNECYEAIKIFTGFDLRKWLDTYADWKNDISDELKKHLQDNDLLKYLTW